jgi:hypothetical protein
MSVHLHSCIYLQDNRAANRKGKDKSNPKTGRKHKNKDKVEDPTTKKSKKST